MNFEDGSIGELIAGPVRIAAQYASEAAANLASLEAAETEKPQLTTFVAEGRTWLLDRKTGTYREIRPPAQDLTSFPIVASLQGVAATAKRFLDPCKSVITVGPQGVRAYGGVVYAEGQDHVSRIISCPYFSQDAPANEFEPDGLFGWLDRFRGNIGMSSISDAEEKAIWAALRTLRAVKAETYEVEDHGGSSTVRAKSEAGVVGDTQIPKFLMIRHRRGVADFVVEHVYRLRARVPRDKSGITFSVTHLSTDGAHDKFVSWAVAALQLELNGQQGSHEPWIVTAGD